jgi:hypothetical protein
MTNRAQAQPVSPLMQMMEILWPGAMAVQAIQDLLHFVAEQIVDQSLRCVSRRGSTHIAVRGM